MKMLKFALETIDASNVVSRLELFTSQKENNKLILKSFILNIIYE